jgi:hypothetical protein
MRMLSEPQTNMAWEEWLASEMRAEYFADLCSSFNRRHRWATWATLLLSSGAAVALIGRLAVPPWTVPTLALLAAGVSLYSLVAQNPKSAADCADLHSRWNKLAMDYRDLWMSWYADEAADRLAQLNERRAEASKSGAAYHYDEKRMLKWYELVVQNRVRHPAAA